MTNAYVGLPMEKAEAIRLCGRERFDAWSGTMRKPPQLGLRYTDKGQYVLGVECEIGSVWDLPTLSTTLQLLSECERQARVQLAHHKIDISLVKIYSMEGDPEEFESFPEMRVIIWN